ncbi:MAG TPA: alpha-2-macroglobulin family protein, partial [Dehalococcoidales bacterium]|nr:alpha-2-macroglobulin family protein [Dehalococcoidales bacterium]
KAIVQSQSTIKGKGQIQLNVPDVAPGEYILEVKGDNFKDQATVKLENQYLVFLETDKPIYKPGQTIFIRIMTLNPELRPVAENATVDVQDAKGIKIFRTEAKTDEFGMTSVELPLSSEPNLGTWKITAKTEKSETQLDVRVEEYVLPKYEISVDLPRDWFLVSETIKGKVAATYSFGKPVKGELQIKALKYVGTWQNYATVNLAIDGSKEFEIPAAGYVAGVPAAQGQGNVKLEFTVTENATAYVEKTNRMLTVSQSSVNLSIIPASASFKPGLPFSFMVISRTPDNQLVDTPLKAQVSYVDQDFKTVQVINLTGETTRGKKVFELNPPSGSIALTIDCNNGNAYASRTIESAYSPTGNFINIEQITEGELKVGDTAKFWVYSTNPSSNFYYEVIARGQVVFSSYSQKSEIALTLTPAMSPSARILIYQILPNSEVAADYLPFKVTAGYPHKVTLSTSVEQAKPGDNIDIIVQTEGVSQVGLAAVDKSVFILAENRMNLQQVFDELEKLYMNPQIEVHSVSINNGITNRGAQEVFQSAGVIVLTNSKIPEGKKYQAPVREMLGRGVAPGAADGIKMAVPAVAPAPVPSVAQSAGPTGGLAEVQRVRQFFPETWLWKTVKTDSRGKATINALVPDSITTWMLRAVALSKTEGLGISENQLTVFQPFFLTVDLPYSAIRGEEFPVSTAIYNYLDKTQDVRVEIQAESWFELLGPAVQNISIAANDIGGAKFKIRPVKLGAANPVKITARSLQAADSVIKTLVIDAEGVANEAVDNLVLANGKTLELSTAIPVNAIDGSGRAYLAVTSSFLTQTMDGLESLIQMPFGCGEQNMIILAPNVYITKYLKASGQLKPEIMAKSEKLMLTGYQRQLTYRRSDNSFSAFGQSDATGSLWLSAFILKCFSEAKGLIYIDPDVLEQTKKWILSKQNGDGSFDAVGFVHHQEMLGGIQGKTALTAYVAIALKTAGDISGVNKAAAYLEKQLAGTDDSYTIALLAYALAMAGSPQAQAGYEKLMKLAKENENGLYWGSDEIVPAETGGQQPGLRMMPPVRPGQRTTSIEATAYATLALIKQGDILNASRAAKWLVSKRNAFGGYGSTQDTVMSLQALTEFSSGVRPDADLTVTVQSSQMTQKVTINASNFDVLQIIELPVNDTFQVSVQGKGEAIGQVVRRFNLPAVISPSSPALSIDVQYDSTEIAVNDELKISVKLAFNPSEKIEAGMTILDIAIPTGFAAVKESIEKLVSGQPVIKRFEISGRKVIFYLDNLKPGDRLALAFSARALYPVKAKGVTSQAYSYYKPEISSQSLGQDVTVK